MKKLFSVVMLLILVRIANAQIEEVSINPYDWANERQRLEWAIQAENPCTQQACVLHGRLDSLLVVNSITGEKRIIQAYMRNADGTPGRVYLVNLLNGQVNFLIARDEWPNTIDPTAEPFDSAWYTFAVIWNLLTGQ